MLLRTPACSHSPRDCQPAGHQIDVILLDFSKAFNKVPRSSSSSSQTRLLCHSGNTFHWTKWFLVNITQGVLLWEIHSTQTDVTSRVPQGTVLGLLLFLSHINYLPDVVHVLPSCAQMTLRASLLAETRWLSSQICHHWM